VGSFGGSHFIAQKAKLTLGVSKSVFFFTMKPTKAAISKELRETTLH